MMLKNTYRYFLLVFIFLSGCQETDVAPQQALTPEEEQLLLGNPSGATADESNLNNYLMQKPLFALSYSRDRGTPNWVSWHESEGWLGAADRQDNFRSDPAPPKGWYRVTASSYTGSGFDRGHNTHSADRTRSAEDNSATFLMTNMIPQAPRNNQETWAGLEAYTCELVGEGMEAYVVMGSYGEGGAGSKGSARTIDQGRVTVPY